MTIHWTQRQTKINCNCLTKLGLLYQSTRYYPDASAILPQDGANLRSRLLKGALTPIM